MAPWRNPSRPTSPIGVKEIVRRLEALEKAHGVRFAPAPALVEHARIGRPFYGVTKA